VPQQTLGRLPLLEIRVQETRKPSSGFCIPTFLLPLLIFHIVLNGQVTSRIVSTLKVRRHAILGCLQQQHAPINRTPFSWRKYRPQSGGRCGDFGRCARCASCQRCALTYWDFGRVMLMPVLGVGGESESCWGPSLPRVPPRPGACAAASSRASGPGRGGPWLAWGA